MVRNKLISAQLLSNPPGIGVLECQSVRLSECIVTWHTRHDDTAVCYHKSSRENSVQASAKTKKLVFGMDYVLISMILNKQKTS